MYALIEVIHIQVNYFGYSRMNNVEKFAVLDKRFLNFQGTIACHKFLNKISSTNLAEKTRENSQGHNKGDDFDQCGYRNGSYPTNAMGVRLRIKLPYWYNYYVMTLINEIII